MRLALAGLALEAAACVAAFTNPETPLQVFLTVIAGIAGALAFGAGMLIMENEDES